MQGVNDFEWFSQRLKVIVGVKVQIGFVFRHREDDGAVGGNGCVRFEEMDDCLFAFDDEFFHAREMGRAQVAGQRSGEIASPHRTRSPGNCFLPNQVGHQSRSVVRIVGKDVGLNQRRVISASARARCNDSIA